MTKFYYWAGSNCYREHFTDDKLAKGNDHYHAVDQRELTDLMNRIKLSEVMLSSDSEFIKRGLDEQEVAISNARRSLFYTSDSKIGSILSSEDFIAKRPGNGVSPKHIKKILGKKLTCDVQNDQSFSWDHIQNGN